MKCKILYLIIIVILSSCKHRESAYNEILFENIISLHADSIYMDVTIKPGIIHYADPYIIVSDLTATDGCHYAVFNDSLKYLYSFCIKGDGPQEFLMPSVVKNTGSNGFMVKDFAKESYGTYILTDTSAIYENGFKMRQFEPYESLWEINKIGDAKYLAKGVAPKRAIRRLIDFDRQEILDSIDQSFDLLSIMGKDYFTEFDDFWMVANQNKFACAYFFIDRIEFGKIANDKLSVNKVLGALTPPDFYKYTSEKLSGKYEYNVDYNIVYYEWMYGTEKMVYASHFGFPWGDIKKHSSILEIFDYDGTPETKCNLDIPLSSFIVIDDKRVIGINLERSDDYFYTYDL